MLPEGPPFDPASPSPDSRICIPPSIPAGILTAILRCSRSVPAPWQVSHGVAIVEPLPLQVGQAVIWVNWPKTLR